MMATSASKAYDGFFIGYINGVPPGARLLILTVSLLFVGLMAGAGYLTSYTQADPGPGKFSFKYRTFTGILETAPYPLLRLPPSEAFPNGHTLLLSGQGKRGIQGKAAPLDGTLVDVGGFVLKRGDIDMLQVGGRVKLGASKEGLPPEQEAAIDRSVTDLGVWRLTGEICDGKCYPGAMRPGTGIAHKACANLCLTGGVPPVFVTTSPVEGSEFLLLAGPDGEPLGEAINSWVAARIHLDGQIERRGDLLVFKVDLDTAGIAE